MQVFSATLNQMFVLFTFMASGYFLNFKGILPLNTSIALSRLETNVLVPCLVFNTFYKYCTVENVSQKWSYIVYGTIITIASIVIGVFLSKLFAKDNYLQKIYTYSFAVANFSFMGNAVVLGIFGEDTLFDYMIFTLPLCLYVYSFGTASLIPKKENESNKFSFKVFLSPICMSMLFGAIAGLIGVPLPKFLVTAISSAGACMSPLAMILTGFVVANFSIKTLAKVKRIYLASILRLIVLPIIFVLVLKLFKTDSTVIMLTLCATAMPLGLNTVVFPAAYGGDTTPGASMALISHLMSIITIPIMFTLFI
ncbi:MAG: AEC family transporter [Acutalibacteraceae bacterium]|nr:AEC family transporter [Acutalibacteraceae bacterium]